MTRQIATAFIFLSTWALSLFFTLHSSPGFADSFFSNDSDFLYMRSLGEGKCQPEMGSVIASFLMRRNPELSRKTADVYASDILELSRKYGVDPLLVTAIMVKESNANASTKSHGCLGLMQVKWSAHKKSLPKAFPHLKSAKDLMHPKKNLEAGIYLFANFIRLSEGDIDRALNRYKGGDSQKYKARIHASYKTMASMLRSAGLFPAQPTQLAQAERSPVIKIQPLSFSPLPADDPLVTLKKNGQ